MSDYASQLRQLERGTNSSRYAPRRSILDLLDLPPLTVVPKSAPVITWASQARYADQYRKTIRPCSLAPLGKQAAVKQAAHFLSQFGVTL